MSSRPILLVHGYIREHESLINVSSNILIPDSIKQIIYLFFPKKCTIFGIGSNDFRELGSYDSSKIDKLQELTVFRKFTFEPDDIYYGYFRFTIKTTDHQIYSIGNNSCGDCAVGSAESVIETLTEIDMKNIKIHHGNNYISCVSNGGNHMFMCINNIIYANGNSSSGQFGCDPSIITHKYTHRSPTDIHFPFKNNKIIQIECGYSHSLFLNDAGKMLGCGANSHGQIGIGTTQNKVDILTAIHCDANIKRIDCGAYHNLCISDKHQLYVFGRNSCGNETYERMYDCGVYDGLEKILTPMIHPYFEKRKKDIIYIATKDYHSLCIDSKNKAFLFGNNSSHQISKTPDKKRIVEFQAEYTEFKDCLIVEGSCGLDHTVLLTKNNMVLGFGGNGKYQTNPGVTSKYAKDPHIFTTQEIGIKEKQKVLRVMATDRTTLIICEAF